MKTAFVYCRYLDLAYCVLIGKRKTLFLGRKCRSDCSVINICKLFENTHKKLLRMQKNNSKGLIDLHLRYPYCRFSSYCCEQVLNRFEKDREEGVVLGITILLANEKRVQ